MLARKPRPVSILSDGQTCPNGSHRTTLASPTRLLPDFPTTKPLDSSTRLGVPTDWNFARLHGEVDGFLAT